MTRIYVENREPAGDHRVNPGTKRAGVRPVVMYYMTLNTSFDQTSRQYSSRSPGGRSSVE